MKPYKTKFEENSELKNLIVDYEDHWGDIMPLVNEFNNIYERVIGIIELSYALDSSLPKKIEKLLIPFLKRKFKQTMDF